MSVIYGKIHFDKKPVAEAEIGLMKNRLHHWQAEASYTWQKDNVALGHLMLYNTPESLHEKLPFYDAEARIAITADARIDNRAEILHHLHLKGREQVMTDSDLILKLYIRYGVACVNHLAGDFAFAIWDEDKQQLFCARDHIGIKPFFYYADHRFFAFASEKKGLLAIPEADQAIDKDFFYSQLYYPVKQPGTATLYKNIRRLAPAHRMILHAAQGKLVPERYWTLDVEKQTHFKRKADCHEAFKHHFDEAVRCRLRSHYAIGAELSGGLDSSAIVGAASYMLKGQALKTFSNIPPDNAPEVVLQKSERKYIEDVIRFNHINDYTFINKNSWEDPLDEADFLLEVNDGVEMIEPLWQIGMKKAAMEQQVRTLLSGFPGDEMITDRGKYSHIDLLSQKKLWQYVSSVKNRSDIKSHLLPLLPPSLLYTLHRTNNILVPDRTGSLNGLRIPAQYRVLRNEAIWQDTYHREQFKSYRHFLRAKFLQSRVGLRLETETRFGIYFRMEPRFPMADINLVQFYMSIPDNWKYGGRVNREMYRNAVSAYLPDTIYNRITKTGNIMPFRTMPHEVEKRKMALKKILATGVKSNLVEITDADKVSQVHLSLFRWLQKNFKH